MSKLKINLLPTEVVILEKDIERKVLSTRISTGMMTVFTVITLIVVGIYLTQKINISAQKENLKAVENQVTSFKEQEGVVSFVKQRLISINKIIDQNSNQERAFSTVTALIPPTIKVQSFAIDQKGSVQLGGESNGIVDLDTFFENLSDPTKNNSKITSTSVESLSQGAAGKIRFDLTINTNTKQ